MAKKDSQKSKYCSLDLYNFIDKGESLADNIGYMLSRCQSMFTYKGLPETIPKRDLELLLQTNGNVCFVEVNGDLYSLTGGMGGEPNAYHRPTKYTIANPALKLSKTYTIDSDCVVVPNDSMYMGLLPLHRRYATKLVENDITMLLASINMRTTALISAADDATKASAEVFLKQLFEGKLGVIGERALFESLKTQPYTGAGANNTLTNLIEMHQYTKASWFNELGLNANYNMKREAINSDESQLNEDALAPLVDDMLECRKTGLEKVNAMFGTNITVDLASSWKEDEAHEEDEEDDSTRVENEEEEEKDDSE